MGVETEGGEGRAKFVGDGGDELATAFGEFGGGTQGDSGGGDCAESDEPRHTEGGADRREEGDRCWGRFRNDEFNGDSCEATAESGFG